MSCYGGRSHHFSDRTQLKLISRCIDSPFTVNLWSLCLTDATLSASWLRDQKTQSFSCLSTPNRPTPDPYQHSGAGVTRTCLVLGISLGEPPHPVPWRLFTVSPYFSS